MCEMVYCILENPFYVNYALLWITMEENWILQQRLVKVFHIEF
jgi:hypothetical protein